VTAPDGDGEAVMALFPVVNGKSYAACFLRKQIAPQMVDLHVASPVFGNRK
jgi:hypothetical protein